MKSIASSILVLFIGNLVIKTVIGQGWKIAQPHQYIMLNGEYFPISLPNPVPDTSSPFLPEVDQEDSESILQTLNPVNMFSKFWRSLPNLSIFKENGEAGSEDEAIIIPPTVPALSASPVSPTESSASSISSVASYLPSFLTGFFSSTSNTTSEIQDPNKKSFFGPAFGNVRKPLHFPVQNHRWKRSIQMKMNGFQARNEPQKFFYYRPIGQGSFARYEFPIKHPSTTTTQSSTDLEDPFPCPKVGLWTYDGVFCTSLHAKPRWSCKPIDLVVSGKLVLCRNKVHI